MKLQTNFYQIGIIYLICVLINLFTSCKKEIVPLSHLEDTAFINFFDASEVFSVIGRDNYIYINDSITKGIYRNGFPKFEEVTATYPKNRTFPRRSFMHPHNTIFVHNAHQDMYDNIYWFPMQQGEYKFIFSTDEKVFVKDTTLKLEPKRHYTLYLLDDPKKDGEFNIISFPEDTKNTEGKIRLRVLHLSPDIGGIRLIRKDIDGSIIKENFPEVLNYKDVTDYIDIDTTGSYKTNGRILLAITDAKNPEQMYKMQLLPPEPGGNYILLLKGHKSSTTRKLLNNDGTYKSVTINPRIRTLLRRLN